ncbi:YggT family protein [Orbus mooreae]|uniref:YggT family protein n=1 Tax=Orbus mooreae TaxID=3074107 RepID=UPI00370DCF94
MSSPLFFIINTLLTLCIYAFILRAWMQYTQVNFYNPFTQFIIKCTQPIVGPLRKVLPPIGSIDTATFLILYIIALLKFIFLIYSATTYPLFSGIYLLCALLTIVYSIGNLIFWMLIVRAILSWISRSYSPLEEVLSQLTEPLISPIRRIVPPIGSIDISFMIFVFVLMILNMVAMHIFGQWWFIVSL